MDIGSIREWVTETTFGAIGIPGTVTLEGATPIDVTVLWLQTETSEAPMGADVPRRDLMRSLAIRRAEVPNVPRGTLITVAERAELAAREWKVDSFLEGTAEHHRVLVRPNA